MCSKITISCYQTCKWLRNREAIPKIKNILTLASTQDAKDASKSIHHLVDTNLKLTQLRARFIRRSKLLETAEQAKE